MLPRHQGVMSTIALVQHVGTWAFAVLLDEVLKSLRAPATAATCAKMPSVAQPVWEQGLVMR